MLGEYGKTLVYPGGVASTGANALYSDAGT